MKILKRFLFIVITPFWFIGWIISSVLWIPFWIIMAQNLFPIYEKNMLELRDWLVPGDSWYENSDTND